MAIILGNKTLDWPRPKVLSYGWYKAASGDSGVYYPGFSNDTAAGYSILISGTYNNTTFIYYTDAGVQITDGVWGSNGLERTNFSGGTAVRIVNWWMDSADALLYFILIKFDQTQKQLALASVNKSGVIVQKPWRNVSAADGNGEVGHLNRAGGDGSGNFNVTVTAPTAASAWTRGKLFTFAVSDGALTTSDLVPANAPDARFNYNFRTFLGPTTNGIYARVYGVINTYAGGQAPWGQGGLWNTTTGRGKFDMMFPTSPWGPLNSTGNSMLLDQAFGWRGYQTFKNYDGYATQGMYDRTEMFTFLDALARDVGIL